MGSRYGGLKQLDPVGPQGQTIMDYSVRDAARAGFDRVVFVIRRDFEPAFRTELLPRYESILPVELAYQELQDLPAGFGVPDGRTKPWGTAHAIWSARHAITHPFLAINADDFYGADSFARMAAFLEETPGVDSPLACALAGFALENTLSAHGGVSRGVCRVSEAGWLEEVNECTEIRRADDSQTGYPLVGRDSANAPRSFSGTELVSMNFWGFPSAIFPALGSLFAEFLDVGGATDPKAEFYIPNAVTQLIEAGAATVRVLPTSARWFGVTYREDREAVVAALRDLE